LGCPKRVGKGKGDFVEKKKKGRAGSEKNLTLDIT